MTTDNNINKSKVKADITDQGPSCACGKVDLYEEWLKQNKAWKQEETSTSTSKAVDPVGSSNGAGYEVSNLVQTNK